MTGGTRLARVPPRAARGHRRRLELRPRRGRRRERRRARRGRRPGEGDGPPRPPHLHHRPAAAGGDGPGRRRGEDLRAPRARAARGPHARGGHQRRPRGAQRHGLRAPPATRDRAARQGHHRGRGGAPHLPRRTARARAPWRPAPPARRGRGQRRAGARAARPAALAAQPPPRRRPPRRALPHQRPADETPDPAFGEAPRARAGLAPHLGPARGRGARHRHLGDREHAGRDGGGGARAGSAAAPRRARDGARGPAHAPAPARALGRPPGGAPRHGREARRLDAGGRGARGRRARAHRRGGADGVRLGAPRGRAARARRRAPGSRRGGGARPPARGGGSGGALRRGEPPRPPRGAPRARALRRHRRGARPARDGTRAPQPCRPPARHRARHRPQPPPPPLVLPHPQHGAGRLRSARDRDHGAGGARPPQAGPEARRPGAPGAAPGGPPRGARARRPPTHGRRARPHALRRGPAAPRRALGGPPRDRGRGGRGGGRARAVGGRAPRGPARAAARAAGRAAPRAPRRRRAPPSARERGIMSTVRGRPSALAEPHPYPGRLITVEGIDGSGKSTQLLLLDRWLTARGVPVRFTEWNSSRLVRRAMKRGKRKDLLTPTTFSLLHAVDFADRLTYQIVPPLKAGMIVLADRYVYTAFGRDVARGVHPAWVRALYSFAPRPDLALYFRVPIEISLERLLAGRAKLKYHEAGMDVGLSLDPVESFRMFQSRVLEIYDHLAEEFGLRVVDATADIPAQQKIVRRLVRDTLRRYEGKRATGSADGA